jgi:glycosyltransferase involved in cell wall biosynthesis
MATALNTVLFVIDNLEFGGGERGFLQLIRTLPGDGWTVSVAAHPGGLFEVQARAAGAEFLGMDMSSRAGVATIARLYRLVRSGRFTIVHSQGARADFFARMALWSVPGVRLVSTVQMPVDGFAVASVRSAAYRFFDRLARPRVDRFVVVSQALKRRLVERWRLPEERVTLIHNGVETDRLVPSTSGDDARRIREELGLGEHARLVGAVGRLVWQKGFEHLLAALPGVAARVPEVPSVLRACDVLAVPSLQEGFPMVTLEAMALGVPIVATEIEGIAEQLDHDRQALLVPPAQPRALTSAVLALLQDQALARRLAEAGRHRVVEAYNVGQAVAATRRLYAELAIGTPAGQPVP